ncbi:MAG: hypothetical protein ABW007_04245 [Chitinophagaceae bacterium]
MKRIFFGTLLLVITHSLYAQPVLKNLSLTAPTLDILYIGVENSLVVEDVSDIEHIEIEIGERVFEEYKGRFHATVHTVGTVKADVYRKTGSGRQLLFSKNYRTAPLPAPAAGLIRATDTVLTVASIIASPHMQVFMPGSYFVPNMAVVSYSLEIRDGNGEIILEETRSAGHRLSEGMMGKIKNLNPGDRLLFNNIRMSSSDGRMQKTEPFTIYIK